MGKMNLVKTVGNKHWMLTILALDPEVDRRGIREEVFSGDPDIDVFLDLH